MLSPEQSATLLDTTMDVLRTDVPTLTPQTGKGILDNWLNAVRQADNAHDLVDAMEELKTLLEAGTDPASIETALGKLADQTRLMSSTVGAEGELAPRLEALSSALRSLAGQLGNR